MHFLYWPLNEQRAAFANAKNVIVSANSQSCWCGYCPLSISEKETVVYASRDPFRESRMNYFYDFSQKSLGNVQICIFIIPNKKKQLKFISYTESPALVLSADEWVKISGNIFSFLVFKFPTISTIHSSTHNLKDLSSNILHKMGKVKSVQSYAEFYSADFGGGNCLDEKFETIIVQITK